MMNEPNEELKEGDRENDRTKKPVRKLNELKPNWNKVNL